MRVAVACCVAYVELIACGLTAVALKSKGFVNQLTILAVNASSQLTKWNFQNILNILEQFTTKHDDR